MRPIPLIPKNYGGSDLARLWLDQARARPGPDKGLSGLLVALPPAWNNKFQVLLYGAAAKHGFTVVGVRTPADLAHICWHGPILLHAHWFASLFHGARSEAEATMRLSQAQAQIDAFRTRTGARLLWTAHNVFPHGNAFPETFLSLRRWIFESFDAVHAMHPEHLPELERHFGCKAPPAFTVPHMTYDGIVPDLIDQTTARARFGLSPATFVVGFFGSLQPYKGIPAALQAVEELVASAPQERPVAAIVAGLPVDPGTVREIAETWGRTAWLRFLPQEVPDHEIQYIYRASDMMILPYDDTLNSGAAMMAATFGRPLLMRPGLASSDLVGSRLLFPGSPSDLGRVAERLKDPDAPAPRLDPDWHALRRPAAVSEDFMRNVRHLVSDGSS